MKCDMKNFFRHEQKYICNYEQMVHLKNLLLSILPCDCHSLGDTYHISSLYFDTYDDRFLMESVEGLPYRKKYRIRCYNHEMNKLKLECKESCFSMKRKEFICLDHKKANALICQNFRSKEKIIEDFYSLQKTELLQPKIVINYDRTAFVDQDFNIRVTLDTNITASKNETSLGIIETNGKGIIDSSFCILEVKYNSCLPDYIARLLRLENLEQVSFSKYVRGRLIIEPHLNCLK